MARKAKPTHSSSELWIAPRFNLKGADGERAWDHRYTGDPSGSRFLELADIALGLRKETRKRRPTSHPGNKEKLDRF